MSQKNQLFEGKTFVHTGALPSLHRNEFPDLGLQIGHEANYKEYVKAKRKFEEFCREKGYRYLKPRSLRGGREPESLENNILESLTKDTHLGDETPMIRFTFLKCESDNRYKFLGALKFEKLENGNRVWTRDPDAEHNELWDQSFDSVADCCTAIHVQPPDGLQNSIYRGDLDENKRCWFPQENQNTYRNEWIEDEKILNEAISGLGACALFFEAHRPTRENSSKFLGVFKGARIEGDTLVWEQVGMDALGCEAKSQATKISILVSELKDLLENNHQLILTGAPGTGKTFMARQLAAAMIQSTEEELDSTEQFKFVQFHPGYDYSDFVIGLKPKLVGQQVVFEWEDGVFKKLCDTAKKASEKKFVMVIDEINRADLSRVFGELFFCLEENYRGKEIDLPNGEPFTIPENVYIIGTMNDIDRSVESMDFALRRRFAWREVKADDTGEQIIRSADKVNETDKKTALEKMIAVNVKLGELGFGEEYKLGGAYFKKIEKYTSASDKWTCLWDNHIKVILQEYLRGRRDANTNLEDLKKAYDAKAEKNSEEKQ